MPDATLSPQLKMRKGQGTERTVGASVRMFSTTVNARDGNGERHLAGPIDLAIAPGEVVGLVGPSGAGKTTLLRLIAGLLAPTSGSVEVRSVRPDDDVRIGYAPQSPSLMPWLNLVENVCLPLRLGSMPIADAAMGGSLAYPLLQQFALEDDARLYPHALSGGMQSRAALARALIDNPDLLLLDEPFGSLDDITAENVLLQLAPHTAVDLRTTIFVAHNLPQAVFLADRLIVCSQGPATIIGEVRVRAPKPRPECFFRAPELNEAVSKLRNMLRRPTP